MTVFGNKDIFAVEFIPVPPEQAEHLKPECNFTIWVSGRDMGDLELQPSIFIVAAEVWETLVDRRNRRHDELAQLSAKEVIKCLDAWLSDQAHDSGLPPPERWSGFRLFFMWSIFGQYKPEDRPGWQIYLVENAEWGRIIFFNTADPSNVYETPVPAGYVDSVLMEAYPAIDAADP